MFDFSKSDIVYWHKHCTLSIDLLLAAVGIASGTPSPRSIYNTSVHRDNECVRDLYARPSGAMKVALAYHLFSTNMYLDN